MTKRLTSLLTILTIVPIVTVIAVESNKHILIWHFRIVDFVDLIVLAPFFAIMFYLLFETINPIGKYRLASLIAIFLFLYGHAMHVTANSINTFITEVHDYKEQIPNDAYDVIFFLDEDLSHYIIFIAFFVLLCIWSALIPSAQIAPVNTKYLIAIGFLQGAAQTIAMIEAQKTLLLSMFIITLPVYIVWVYRQQVTPSVVQIYMRGVVVALIIVPLLYLVLFGNFTSPSERF